MGIFQVQVRNLKNTLTILTGKNNNLQIIPEFVKTEPWLLVIDIFDTGPLTLAFYKFHCPMLICLNIVVHEISLNRMLASCNKFYGKMWVSFWLNT